MSVSNVFPFRRRPTSLGPLSDPTIPVAIRTSTGDREYEFLIDTGADLSVVPRRLAREVGVDWSSVPSIQAVGIGHSGVAGRLGDLPIRLGNVELSVRCIYLDRPDAPFILGRADFLERFVLTFDLGQGKIILTEIP